MRPTEPAGSSERSAGGRVNQTGLARSEEHTSELQSQSNLVCRLLLEKKKKKLRYSLYGRLLPYFAHNPYFPPYVPRHSRIAVLYTYCPLLITYPRHYT